MDRTGHSVIEFDRNNIADLAEAERRFKKLIKQGFIPAGKMGDGKHRVDGRGERALNPVAEETLFIPALKGG
jgi:hypothetical protein